MLSTDHPALVASLLEAAGQFDTYFTDEALRAVVSDHLAHMPPADGLGWLLRTADALSRAGLYEAEGVHWLAEAWREAAHCTAVVAIDWDQLFAVAEYDTTSSASRQHFIDTGSYLPAGGAVAVEAS